MRLETGYDVVVDRAARTRYVLLGAASDGTHEFHAARAELTRRLITEAGFTAVAVVGDWSGADRVNHYVRGDSQDASAEQALRGFRSFPSWVWRNTVVAEFVAWLRGHNDGLRRVHPSVGFYGLDLYSLHASMAAVVGYLDGVDPEAAARARERFACFHQIGRSPAAGPEPCEEAIELLVGLRRRAAEGSEDRFHAEQNARLVVHAEDHYRAVLRSDVAGWNVRERHMAETLAALTAHLEGDGASARTVVWAHNAHAGDVRATELARRRRLSLGQLMRQRAGAATLLIGLTTYEGSVTAARDWGEPPEPTPVPPAVRGSHEHRLHQRGLRRVLLEPIGLPGQRRERAIGVVYRPAAGLSEQYFDARIGDQFDAVAHFEETQAVEPLEQVADREPTHPWASSP
jgi:erythromycin esterase-like protein